MGHVEARRRGSCWVADDMISCRSERTAVAHVRHLASLIGKSRLTLCLI